MKNFSFLNINLFKLFGEVFGFRKHLRKKPSKLRAFFVEML